MSDIRTELIPTWLEIEGRRIRHVLLRGGRDAVVLVHGFGGSLETWSANLAALASAGFTVAALDLPGHGESSLDVGSGSLDELVAIVQGYLHNVGIERAHLVGHSMGAALCLALTDREPGRVRSLTLVGPAGLGQKINADYIRGMIGARGREELRPLVEMLFADPARVPEEMLERTVAHKQREGVIESLGRIAGSRYGGTPSGRQLREIAGSVPTLVIWGREDRLILPPDPGEFARDGITFEVLPACGHMVQLEGAAEFNRRLADFLRGLPR